MEISYTTTPATLRHYYISLMFRGKGRWKFLAYPLLICLGICSFMPWILSAYNDYVVSGEFPWILIYFGILFFGVPAVALGKRLLAVLRGEKNTNGTETHTVRISQENLVHRGDGYETVINWTGIRMVAEYPDVINILLANELGYLRTQQRPRPLYIPIQSFPSREAAHTFCETATTYWKEARESDAPIALDTIPADVSFSLTNEDVAHFIKFNERYKKRFAFLNRIPVTSILIGLSAPLWMHSSSFPPAGWYYFWLPIPVILFGFLVYYWVLRLTKPETMKKAQVFHEEITEAAVSLTPEHVARITARERLNRSWPLITDITMDDRLIYFFMPEKQGFYVPVRAFASPSLAQSFYKRAVAYWKGEAPVENSDEGIWPPPPRISSPDKADIE